MLVSRRTRPFVLLPLAAVASLMVAAPVAAAPVAASPQLAGPEVAIAAAGQSARIGGGNDHTLWVTAGQRVAATGGNFFGQLGDGTRTDRTRSVVVPSLHGVVAVAAGERHSLALDSTGRVWAWGDNSFGKLGDGSDVTFSTVPVPVVDTELSGVVAVAAGAEHSLALDSTGRVWAWGANFAGQLGDGGSSGSFSPVPVPVDDTNLTGVVTIAAGAEHNLALDSAGAAWAWGENFSGQLGDGTTTNRSVPVPVDDTDLTGVAAVAAGGFHSLAVDSTGAAWAWGNNGSGRLGDGTTTNRLVPVPVDATNLTDVVAVAGGGSHSLAIDSTGSAWAWGDNGSGRLGDGGSTDSPVPVQVDATELGGVAAVAAGGGHSLAMDAAGGVWAWGPGFSGQLGNGTTSSSPMPASVVPIGPPVASFEVESCEQVFPKGTRWVCNLDASGAAGDTVAWDWEFCEGNTGTGERLFVFVPESGCDFTLTVTDSQDRTDSTTMFLDPTLERS